MERSSKVSLTIGTAGKVFSAEPGRWQALPKPKTIVWEQNTKEGCCFKNEGSESLEVNTHRDSIAKLIDHTQLSPETKAEEISILCREAKIFGFASVCVNPVYVSLASSLLKGSEVKVSTVVGFPLGATTTRVKIFEIEEALANGADEIDAVMQVGALKSGENQMVLDELVALRKATEGKILKIIIETGLLTTEEKIRASLLGKKAGADYIKTSTGFLKSGATVEDIQLIRFSLGSQVGIKASGGIKSRECAQELMRAGATRIGTSASLNIINGQGAFKRAS